MTKGGFWTTNTGIQPKAQFRFRVEIDGLAFEDAPGTSGDSNRGDKFNDAKNDTNVAWYAKKVDKPGFEFMSNVPEGDYFNLGSESAVIDFNADRPKLKKISMTLVDPSYPNVTRKLLRWVRRTGYNEKRAKDVLIASNQTPIQSLLKTIGHVRIYQLDSTGNLPESVLKSFSDPTVSIRDLDSEIKLELEEWTLYNAYPARIDFGTLEYSSDDLVEIQIDWVYSHFVCRMAKFPRDQSDVEQEFPYFNDAALFGNEDLSKKPVLSIRNCKDRYEATPNKPPTLEEWMSTSVYEDDPCYKAQQRDDPNDTSDSDVGKGQNSD